MALSKTFGWGIACAMSTAAASANTVAITEYIHDPWGSDTDLEWLEIFNYGAGSVDLNGWTISDNSSSAFQFGDVTIGSGQYMVVARNKAAFESRWLEGAQDDRVLGGRPFSLNNSGGDGLILADAGSTAVWSLGYTHEDGAYRAVFLTGNDFSQTNYGVPSVPFGQYVNRNGNDGSALDGIDLGLGYEGNEFTEDAFAFASSARRTDPETGEMTPVEFGSPLAGQYTAVPEPSSIALIALGGGLAFARRRNRDSH